MNDNTPNEDRYAALAAEAFDAANRMKDPDAQLVMRKIARGYLRLASSTTARERTITEARKARKSRTG